MGYIVQIYWSREADHPGSAGRFSLVEVDEAATFSEVCIMLASNDLLIGTEIWTRRGDSGDERIVTRRKPMAFRGEAVIRADITSWRLVDTGAEGEGEE